MVHEFEDTPSTSSHPNERGSVTRSKGRKPPDGGQPAPQTEEADAWATLWPRVLAELGSSAKAAPGDKAPPHQKLARDLEAAGISLSIPKGLLTFLARVRAGKAGPRK